MHYRYPFALLVLAFGTQGPFTVSAEEKARSSSPERQIELQALVGHLDDLTKTRQHLQARLVDGPQVEPVLKSLRKSIAQFDTWINEVEQQIDEHIRLYPDLKTEHEGRAVPMGPSDAARPDKSGYNLFNPTPKELMREMSTDRPDKTESAHTVDAGHFQLETDLVSFSRADVNRETGHSRTDAWAFAPINLKLGLRNNMDLQIVVDTYNFVDTEETRDVDHRLRSALDFYGYVQTAGTSRVRERVVSLADAYGSFLTRGYPKTYLVRY